MVLIDKATCLLKSLSKRLITDCSTECPDTSNKEIIEDFRLVESLLSQYFMIKNCAVAEQTTPDYSKIEFAIDSLIEKYECSCCLECEEYQGDFTPPEPCDISFSGSCFGTYIVPGENVVSVSYNDGSGDTGLPCPLEPTSIGNQTGNTVEAKYLCVTDTPSEKPEECNMVQVNSNTLVYIYYDGTSLGTTQVETAYSAIMDWLHQQPGFTPITSTPTGTVPNTINPGENVFHTIIQGERWLDWAIQPMTGEFNNSNVTINPADPLYPCSFITQGDEDKGKGRIVCGSLAPAVSNWSYDTTTINLPISGVTQPVYQFYDNVTGTFLGEDVVDYDTTTCLPGVECDPSLPCFVANAPGSNIWMGPPPAASPTNDVLVIIFADESECSYHGRASSTTLYPQSFFDSIGDCPCTESTLGYSGGLVNAPTGIFKNDYTEYVSQYNTRQATLNAGEYRCFIYPSCPSGLFTSHMPFPLNVVAAIDSGDNTVTPDGLFEEINLPSSSLYDATRGCAGSSTDPYGGGKLELKRGTNINPYFNQGYGGLDQYGWGYNSEMLAFNNTIFEEDLETFLSDGEPTCSGLDCLALRVFESDNPTTPIVGEIVQVDGVPYTTDGFGWLYVPTLSPGTHTIGYTDSECYSLITEGNCTQYILTVYKGVETFETCLAYSDVQCGCGPDGGLTPDIVIEVGSTFPADTDGVIGSITNETTGVVTTITTDMVSGPDVDGNYKVTIQFENTLNDDIPDGRYTIYLEGIGSPYAEYKECKLILCESATIIQNLFKKFVSNKDCCSCKKPFEDYLQAYALFRALKVVGANDCDYETFIDENITKLKDLLTTAQAGNCKNC